MNNNNKQGFTRSEMLVVIGVVGILAGLLLPALANPKTKGDRITCLLNLRRLIQAWELYGQDNSGRLVMNFQGGSIPNGSQAAPWALGWLNWTTSKDNTNVQLLIDDKYSKLAKYTDRNPALFLCPADRFVSAKQQSAGWTRRTRSLSMNMGIGDGNAETGPWLLTMYRHIRTTAEFVYPGPSDTFVFLEENPDSINDPGFFCPTTRTAWVDQPASYHDAAGAFAFADGHTELKKWTASLATPAAQQIHWIANVTATAFKPNDADIRWVNYHGGRSSTNAF